MLTEHTNVFGENDVAIMILLGKDSRWSKSVAKKLETALFNKWYATDKFNADKVLTGVLGVARNRIHENSRAKSIWANYMDYTRKRVVNY